MSLVQGLRARLRLLFARRAAEERMEEEFRFHVDMEADRLAREAGLDPGEARRRALVAFGGMEQYRETLREERGLARLSGMSLDLKLGLRMLIKYPGLTVVGGLGMAVALAIGVTYFDITTAMLHSTLPFEEGERIVAIELWDVEANEAEHQALHDFAAWRETVRSIDALAAYQSMDRNLIVPGGTAQLVMVAEMTASGFRLTRVPPLLGRAFVEEDERAGAPPVAVIGYDVWRTRFGGDSGVLGRPVRLGNAVHTVVGVMPEGFAFPVRHDLWVPFRSDPLDYRRGEGPGIVAFGRLADGVTVEEAQAELTTVGLRAAAAFPATHERLRPRIAPYTQTHLNVSDEDVWALRLVQLLIILLLGVICVNVAVLIYARTVTRVGEITVRTALGASRRRVVAQLFAEALVLSLGAAIVGLTVGELVLRWLERMFVEQWEHFPFWLDFGLSPGTILYAAGLAVLAAAILGVAPALKATGRGLRSGLSELGGSTGMRLGRTWTALIVAQVAVAVAILPAGIFNAWDWSRYGLVRPAFAADDYLTARLVPERETPPEEATAASESEFAARYGDRLGELERRLEAEPRVADVAFVHRLPGVELPASVEVEDAPPPPESGRDHGVRISQVGVGFFDAFDVQVHSGRGFRYSDLGAAATAVIVNDVFVDEILGGANAVGRDLRYTYVHRRETSIRVSEDDEPTQWYEIVGVVSDDLTVGVDPGETAVRVYHPMALGEIQPTSVVVRMANGPPTTFAPQLRRITAAVDPTLQVADILTFDESLRQTQRFFWLVALAIGLVTLSVLLLSAAGVHALMSFTVAQRRKEIGIRAALGAQPRRLLAGIFAHALGQLALGLAVGIGIAVLFNSRVANLVQGKEAVVVPIAATVMLVVGLLATLGPARRGLRIQPTEALKEQ